MSKTYNRAMQALERHKSGEEIDEEHIEAFVAYIKSLQLLVEELQVMIAESHPPVTHDAKFYCGTCGKMMQFVRPGKWQCVNEQCEACE